MPFLRQDRQWLSAFRRGERQALERTYRTYVREVDRYLRTLARRSGRLEYSQPGVVSDLLQEVFLRAFSQTARESYDGLRDFAPYLYTIARNCFVDLVRKRHRELSFRPEDLPEVPEDTALEDVYDPRVVQALRRFLETLPVELARVYQQRYELGKSQQAACEALGISRRHLRTCEERLRRDLKKALLRAGLAHELRAEATTMVSFNQ